jgi:DNA (cytosine-5)-methyltransferase 3A
MNVLSLFDGISCGRVALERAGAPVEKYYASEIDQYAIKVSKKNYPDIIQLGNIRDWREWDIDFSKIDILFAGFPCQAWSVAGKQKGDEDPRGELVHHLIGIWKKIKRENPNLIFLFENVKMKKEFINYINDLFGCEPILINSSLVSGQNRERYYWTNIPGITQPGDRGILLKDILHESNGEALLKNYGVYKPQKEKCNCIDANYWKGVDNHAQRTQIFVPLDEYMVPFDKTLKIIEKEVQRGKVGYFRQDSQANRVYYIHTKSVILCGEAGGGAAKMGQYLFGCLTPDRLEKRQNGQRFSKGEKFYTLTAQDQHGILIEGYIRKLTPIECERLQTLEDNYTEGISNSQRYKCIGNGWTVDIIAHILSFIPKEKI